MPVYFGYAAAVAALYLLVCLLLGCGLAKSLYQLAANLLLGYGSLAAANMLLPTVGLNIPINAVTLLCSGLLGLPGTVLAAALQSVV